MKDQGFNLSDLEKASSWTIYVLFMILDEMVQDRIRGASLKEIANKHGFSVNAVKENLNKVKT